jgi:hypothetical protein
MRTFTKGYVHSRARFALSFFHVKSEPEVDGFHAVVWEGNLLEFGASLALNVDGGDGYVISCWSVSN